jgi:hypothetical protein
VDGTCPPPHARVVDMARERAIIKHDSSSRLSVEKKQHDSVSYHLANNSSKGSVN